MNTAPIIEIDMDKRCVECQRKGAVPSGLCIGCLTRLMGGKRMRSLEGKAIAARFRGRLLTLP